MNLRLNLFGVLMVDVLIAMVAQAEYCWLTETCPDCQPPLTKLCVMRNWYRECTCRLNELPNSQYSPDQSPDTTLTDALPTNRCWNLEDCVPHCVHHGFRLPGASRCDPPSEGWDVGVPGFCWCEMLEADAPISPWR